MPIVDALLGRISNLPIPFVRHQNGDGSQGQTQQNQFDAFFEGHLQPNDSEHRHNFIARQRFEDDSFYNDNALLDRSNSDDVTDRFELRDRDEDAHRRIDDDPADRRSDDGMDDRDEDTRRETSTSDEQDKDDTDKASAQNEDKNKGREKNGARTAQTHANDAALQNANANSALKVDLSLDDPVTEPASETEELIAAVATTATTDAGNSLETSTETDITQAVTEAASDANTDDATDDQQTLETLISDKENTDATPATSFETLMNLASGSQTLQSTNPADQTTALETSANVTNPTQANQVTTDATIDMLGDDGSLPGLAREVQGIWTWRAPWLQLPGISALNASTSLSTGNITAGGTGPVNGQGAPLQAALANLGQGGGDATPNQNIPGQGQGTGLDNFGQQVANQARQMGQGLNEDASQAQANARNNFQANLSAKGSETGQSNATNTTTSSTISETGQSTETNSSISRAQTAQAMQAASQRAAAGTTANVQVAFHIAKAVQDGNSKISIRLDPPELGRVDVRLEVAADGKVMANVTSDRQDTLDLMQRDAKELEKALNDAGLDANMEDLTFSLQEQQDDRANDNGGDGSKTASRRNEDPGADDDRLPWIDNNRAVDLSI